MCVFFYELAYFQIFVFQFKFDFWHVNYDYCIANISNMSLS